MDLKPFEFSPPFCAQSVLNGTEPVPDDTAALNAFILETKEAAPDMWLFSESEIRKARREGGGIFPLEAFSPHADDIMIDGPEGAIPLRIIRPANGSTPQRAYLHIHGGGWTFGAHDMQDESLQAIADACDCVCISVDYRLAPDHPYPAAQDDCEASALWLLDDGAQALGLSSFTIGGESAGAHLSLITLLRLKERHGITAFAGVNLVCGCYDLGFTPSVRNWGDLPLVLNSTDMAHFRQRYLYGLSPRPPRKAKGGDEGPHGKGGDEGPHGKDAYQAFQAELQARPTDLDMRDADLSPLYADLSGLPPTLVTAGSKDLLLDDSLFLHQRLLAAGSRSHLALYPGGCHVFPAFDHEVGRSAQAASIEFLRLCFDASSPFTLSNTA